MSENCMSCMHHHIRGMGTRKPIYTVSYWCDVGEMHVSLTDTCEHWFPFWNTEEDDEDE